MEGKTAVIFGGAGNIGSHTAQAFLELGHSKVVLVSRREDALNDAIDRIRKNSDDGGRLAKVVGNVQEQSQIEELKREIVKAAGGRVDHIVVSVGFSFYRGKMTIEESSKEELSKILEAQTYAPFQIWTNFYSLVKDNENGSFVMVSGGGQDMYLGPTTGLMTIGGAGNRAVSAVARIESKNDKACVAGVAFMLMVTPDPSQIPAGQFKVLSSKLAGQYLADVATKRKDKGQLREIYCEEDLIKLRDELNKT